jgi:hypothetical protein
MDIGHLPSPEEFLPLQMGELGMPEKGGCSKTAAAGRYVIAGLGCWR